MVIAAARVPRVLVSVALLVGLGSGGSVGCTTSDGGGVGEGSSSEGTAAEADSGTEIPDGGSTGSATSTTALTVASSSSSTSSPSASGGTGGPVDESSSGGEELSSPGCGVDSPASGAFETLSLDVDGTIRTFHILVPASYDPLRPYPIVFRWHGFSGTGLSGGLDIEMSSGEDAIIVGPDGLGTNWSGGSQHNDLALFDALLEVISENYCIDLDNVFSYGYSAGGGMTNLLACVRGDVIRASATVAGGSRGQDCVGEPGVWLLHDADDDSVPLSVGVAVRDRHLAANGCSMMSVPEGDTCVRYEGCSSPVVWCQSSGFGHNIQGEFAPPRVWDFFAQFLER